MTTAEVSEQVARARRAAQWWSTCPPSSRRSALLNWAALIVATSRHLCELIEAEQGKPLDEAYLEIVPSLEQIRWAALHAHRVLKPRRVWAGLPMSNHAAFVDHVPYGVVGVIGPWNYPVFTPAGSLAYALAAGNTVVFKPSEYTPATGAFLVNAFNVANPDLPDGVLTLVTGDGTAGAALIRSGVDKIAFTGSPRTARAVMTAAAESLTPVVLECGGKDPMIVADDADVAAAARAAAWGGMSNGGQTCVGIERVYVTRAVRDEFLAALRAQLSGIRAGGPGAAYGPMTTIGQFDVVQRHVTEALDAGAEAAVGGRESLRRPFVDPVVLVDPPDDADVVVEETFGPVLTVRTVADVDEAIELANSLPYGLGASVFSKGQGHAIATRVRSGMVAINCALAFVGIPALPFGGRGESGFGRIHGADGLREFAQPRSVVKRLFSVPGVEFATLHRTKGTLPVVRALMTARHRRWWRKNP